MPLFRLEASSHTHRVPHPTPALVAYAGESCGRRSKSVSRARRSPTCRSRSASTVSDNTPSNALPANAYGLLPAMSAAHGICCLPSTACCPLPSAHRLAAASSPHLFSLTEYDENGDGTLSFEEYEKMLRGWEADEKEFEEYEVKLKNTFEVRACVCGWLCG